MLIINKYTQRRQSAVKHSNSTAYQTIVCAVSSIADSRLSLHVRIFSMIFVVENPSTMGLMITLPPQPMTSFAPAMSSTL